MPFLNFGGNKNKYCNLSDMNFVIKNIKNIKNRNSDPDPLWTRIHFYGKVDPMIRIHFSKMWIPGSGSTSKMRWIRNAASDNIKINLLTYMKR